MVLLTDAVTEVYSLKLYVRVPPGVVQLYIIGFGDVKGEVSLSPSGDLVEAAARLFDLLHQADSSQAQRIAVAPVPVESLGAAINDRLKRAAAPR